MTEYEKAKAFAWLYRTKKRLTEDGQQGLWPCDLIACLDVLEDCEWFIATAPEEQR